MSKKKRYSPTTKEPQQKWEGGLDSSWCSGTIEGIIEYLQGLLQDGYLALELDYHEGYGETDLMRLETPKEIEERITNWKAEQSRAKQQKKKRDELERKEYERLRRKFEKTNYCGEG